MVRLLMRMLLILAALSGTALAQGASAPLRVGIFPTVSPTQLMTNYQPFREYLERELRQPVEIFTAKDFPTFQRQTVAGNFDIVLTAAHLARVAQRDHGWLPIAHYTEDNRSTLITSKGSPLASLKDLAGRKLAVANRSALVVIIGLHWLSEQGLQPGRDFEILNQPTFSGVAHAVQSGEAALGIVSTATLKQVPASVADGVQIFHVLLSIPYTWAVSPKLRGDAARIQAVLVKFNADLPEGRKFYEVTRHGSIVPVTDEFLRSIDPYVDETRRILREARP